MWTPNPSIVRYERGIARSTSSHINVMGRTGVERHEVPKRVVGRLRLKNLAIGLRA